MSSHQNTLLIQEQGKKVPADLLAVLLNENRSSLGSADLKNGVLEVAVAEGAMPLKDVVDFLNSVSSKAIISFNNFPTNAVALDIQPYIMLFGDGDKTKPLVLSFLEGEFPDYVQPNTVDSTARNAAMEYLRPKIDDTWELVKPDLDKLMLALDKKAVHTDIEREIGAHGSVVLMCTNGYTIQYGKINGKALTADWGWCSNTHGWAPKAEEPVKPAAATTAPVVEGFTKKKFGAPSAPITSVPAAPAAAQKVTLQPAKDTAAPPDASQAWPKGVWYDEKNKKVFAQCPDDILGKEQREKWYQDNAGFVPNKYKQRKPGVTVEVRGSPFKAQAPRLGATAETATATPAPSLKDTTAHILPAKEMAERIPAVVDPVVKENFKKWLDTPQIKTIIEKKGMADPKSFQDFEDKYPSYADLTGVSLEQTFGYAYELRYMMCKDFPEMAAILMLNTVAAYARLLAHTAKLEAKKDEPGVVQPFSKKKMSV